MDAIICRYSISSVRMLGVKGIGVAIISTPLAPGEVYVIDASKTPSVHTEGSVLRKLTSINDQWLSHLRLGTVQKVSFPCKDTREYTHVGHRAIR